MDIIPNIIYTIYDIYRMMVTIFDLIKKRNKLQITQTELANVMGIFPSNVSRIETQNPDCRVSTLEQFDRALDIIKENRNRKANGLIVLDDADFKNTLHKSVIAELERLEHEGQYKGNAHRLAQRLVDMIVKEVHKDAV